MLTSPLISLGAAGLVLGGILGSAQADPVSAGPGRAGAAPAARPFARPFARSGAGLGSDADLGHGTPPLGQTSLSPKVRNKTVLVAGDSWAYHMADGMLSVVPSDDVIIDAGGGGCGIMLPTTPGTAPSCKTWQTQWPSLMSQYKPSAVVLMVAQWDITPQQVTPGGPTLNLTDPAYRQRFVDHLSQAVSILTANGTPLYLENSKLEGDKVFGPWAKIMNGILARFAATRPFVHLLDVRGQLCNDDGCPPVLDGVKVYDVTGHPTPEADKRLADWALNSMFVR